MRIAAFITALLIGFTLTVGAQAQAEDHGQALVRR